MIFEHLFSYACHMFRLHEIQKNGYPDVNGILRAPIESILSTVETFFDCLLFGYTLKHLIDTRDYIHDYPFITYWLVVDMIIMFFSLGYNYMTQRMQLDGEIAKNLITLYSCQLEYFHEQKEKEKLKAKI